MLRVLFKLLFNILVDHFVFEYVIQISMAKVILSGSLIRIVCRQKTQALHHLNLHNSCQAQSQRRVQSEWILMAGTTRSNHVKNLVNMCGRTCPIPEWFGDPRFPAGLQSVLGVREAVGFIPRKCHRIPIEGLIYRQYC